MLNSQQALALDQIFDAQFETPAERAERERLEAEAAAADEDEEDDEDDDEGW